MARAIPSYELYEERLVEGLPVPIHYEPLIERSSKHNWTIRLHRHRRIAQIFLFRTPGVFLQLGDLEYTSGDQTILVVPPGVAHSFVLPEGATGDVVNVRLDDMPASVQQRFAQIGAETDTLFSLSQTRNFAHIANLLGQLCDAYYRFEAGKAELLIALLDLILLYLTSDLSVRKSVGLQNARAPVRRQDAHVDTFLMLIEKHYRNGLSVADYAGRIGISAPHLTRVCREEMGVAPNDLVRQRRLLEAKRMLEYTALPIAEIAHRCGFREAAFFSRSFKAQQGVSPRLYRKQLDG